MKKLDKEAIERARAINATLERVYEHSRKMSETDNTPHPKFLTDPIRAFAVAMIAVQLKDGEVPEWDDYNTAMEILDEADVKVEEQQDFRASTSLWEHGPRTSKTFEELLKEGPMTGHRRILGPITTQSGLEKKISELFLTESEKEKYEKFDPDPDSVNWKEHLGFVPKRKDRAYVMRIYRAFQVGLRAKSEAVRLNCRTVESILGTKDLTSDELAIMGRHCNSRKRGQSDSD